MCSVNFWHSFYGVVSACLEQDCVRVIVGFHSQGVLAVYLKVHCVHCRWAIAWMIHTQNVPRKGTVLVTYFCSLCVIPRH
jgi:hypothetical protein